MSSFLCFVCHSTVNADTNEDIREKYREIIGMNLCQESHLCFICCHFLNKMWLFKSICLKRTLEYPVLFSEKGAINLQKSDLQIAILCPEDICIQHLNSRIHIYNTSENSQSDIDSENKYVQLHEDTNFNNIYDNHDSINKINSTYKENYSNDNTKYKEMIINNDYKQNYDHKNKYCCDNDIDGNDCLVNDSLDIAKMKAVYKEDYCNHDFKPNYDSKYCYDNDFDGNNDSPINDIENDINDVHSNESIQDNDSILNNDHVQNNNHYIQNNDNIINNDYSIMQNNDALNNGLVQNNDAINDNDYMQNEMINSNIESETGGNNDSKIENDKIKKKNKRSKKKDFVKRVLSIEEQKRELNRNRKEKKYLEAVFRCHSCALGFLFKDSYQAHMMRHEESNGEHSCAVCTLRFASVAVYRSHQLNHSERYTCTRCSATVSRRRRQTHLRACKGERDSDIACHLCGNVFSGVNNYQQHLKRVHQAKSNNRIYTCNNCGKTYNNQAALRTHMITHINKKFPCDKCDSIFSSPYTLNQHKKKHSNEVELHHCSSCSLTFNSRKSLLAHKRNTLAHKETVYKCQLCSRICVDARSLQTHTAAVHERTKHLPCHMCTARYSTRKGLLRHLLTHKNDVSKQTPLCHACGESFKSTSILKRHLKNVCEKDKIDNCQYYEQ